ncbi:Protein arginine methyltransferase 5, related [Neospora caninum Liverpool]|uniref:Protein arginine methyltransferase 5, related n=1 Tax=Neospora caninum (strain Liverpool) TaxID=572307 RepID=F0VL70_NEOCL|nr:Protein arginine methyltransferase 5, related [Neospora caninum Liverpool]CBZ54822.1 Protein arginine methyltransferase 5, related [Neospora caninum Liverpool]CEL69541.1 TPA: Protein arginine methyltransferase 5, related [Neospora caninum Liverpool]|eukprot:XP_003884850.1 Protein arginine methyltransferase 5, related [Neospora caninum Liverpool]
MPLHPPSNSCLTGPVYFGVGLPHAAVRTPSALHTHLQTVRSNLQCDFVVIPTAAFSPDFPTSPAPAPSSPSSSPSSASQVPAVRASIPLDHLPVYAAHPEKKAEILSASLDSFSSCSFRGVDGGLVDLPVSIPFTPSTGSDLALDSQTWASSIVCELSPWISPDRCLRPPSPSIASSSPSSSSPPAASSPDASDSPATELLVSFPESSSLRSRVSPQFSHWSFHVAAWQREMQWATHVGAYAVIAPVPIPGEAPVEYARQLRAALGQLQPPSVWVRLPLVYPRDGVEASEAQPASVYDDPWQQWRLIRAFIGHHAALGLCLEVTADLPSDEELDRWFAEPIRAVLVSPAIFTCAATLGADIHDEDENGVGKADGGEPAEASKRSRKPGKRSGSTPGGVGPREGLSVALSPRHFAFLSRCAEHRVKIILRHEEDACAEAADVGALDLASADAFPSLQASTSPGDTVVSASPQANFSVMDLQPYLSYIVARFLQLPTLSPAALFSAPYRDVLQSPMQPLADNLSTMNYEVFEKDPVKYVRYRQATLRRLREIWGPETRACEETAETPAKGTSPSGAHATAGKGERASRRAKAKKTSRRGRGSAETDSDFGDSWSEDDDATPSVARPAAYAWCLGGEDCPAHRHLPEVFADGRLGRLVIMVVGAGRGPLVQAALDALREAEIPLCRVHIYAVEKNSNAIITLRSRQATDPCEGWRAVRVIESDMREVGLVTEKADILISELLGSFGDNELSVECLHGAQLKLLKRGGVSIPTAYVSSVEPVSSPRLWTAIESYGDAKHFESPYVVDLFAVYRAGVEGPLECFHFRHPEPLLPFAGEEGDTRTSGAGGAAETGDRETPGEAAKGPKKAFGERPASPTSQQLTTWRHRRTRLAWHMKADALIHGLAGYFHCCLYKDVYISIDPRSFSEGMFSWFPLFLPFRVPVYVQRGEELEVYLAREGDGHRVWYEWASVKPHSSEIYNHLGKHYFIGK